MENSSHGVSIIIPSRTEDYLNHTIIDVLKNSVGDVEVLPVLDGYELPDVELIHDPRVRYVKMEKSSLMKKRHCINKAVSVSKYDHICTIDAHVSMAKGFDKVLLRDHQPDWVQVLQRRRLDAENWCEQDQMGRPPIDYEYIKWKSLIEDRGLHGYKWDSRGVERKDIMIDSIFSMQASMWFMTKEWFNKMGFMSPEGYTGWGAESEQILFTTLINGGKCKVNKNSYYMHCHKGKKYGRMYHLSRSERMASYAYSYNYWVVEHRDFFVKLINSFMPIPRYPEDWEAQLYKE